MWSSQFWQFDHPYTWVNSGGLGTMGFAVPAAIGAKVGSPARTVWAIDGDGCFQMTAQELVTASAERIPIKVAILNNAYLGMVRQWQELFYEERYSEVYLSPDLPDYKMWAEAMGCVGMRVELPDEVVPAIEKANSIDDRPVVIDFRVDSDEKVYPMVAAGTSQRRHHPRPRAGQEALMRRSDASTTHHILSVLVENKAGVLARVSGLFARRGFNIYSLAVAPTDDERFSRITIVVDVESTPLEQITKQLFKLINVVKISELDPADAVEREMMMVTVKAAADGARPGHRAGAGVRGPHHRRGPRAAHRRAGRAPRQARRLRGPHAGLRHRRAASAPAGWRCPSSKRRPPPGRSQRVSPIGARPPRRRTWSRTHDGSDD